MAKKKTAKKPVKKKVIVRKKGLKASAKTEVVAPVPEVTEAALLPVGEEVPVSEEVAVEPVIVAESAATADQAIDSAPNPDNTAA